MVRVRVFNNFVINVDIEPPKGEKGEKVIVTWYRQRYPMVRVRVFNNFVINVDIEPPSRLPSLRH